MWQIFFFKNHAKNVAGRLAPDLFLFYQKALHEVKAIDQHFSFNTFWYPSAWTYNKNKLYKISDC